jgi:hypothetical protein
MWMSMTKRKYLVWRTRTNSAECNYLSTLTETGLHVRKRDLARTAEGQNRYRIPFLWLKSLDVGPVCVSQSEQVINHMHQQNNEGTSGSKSTLPTTYSPYLLSVFCWKGSQATQLEQLCDFYWLQCYREVTWIHEKQKTVRVWLSVCSSGVEAFRKCSWSGVALAPVS